MFYYDTVQKHNNTSASEYVQAEGNKITTSNQNQSEQSMQEQSNMETMEFMVDYRKKEVKVILEVPKTSNEKVAREFENCLKELYLKKVKVLSMQEREAALYSHSNENQEVAKDEA